MLATEQERLDYARERVHRIIDACRELRLSGELDNSIPFPTLSFGQCVALEHLLHMIHEGAHTADWMLGDMARSGKRYERHPSPYATTRSHVDHITVTKDYQPANGRALELTKASEPAAV